MSTQGIATTWKAPNFVGELFSADPVATPLLSIIGGLTGGKITHNPVFDTAQLFDYPAPKQPSISEKDSIIAPAPGFIERRQQKNVVQIHQATTGVTYFKQSAHGALTGINSANAQPSPDDEIAWQVLHQLIIPAARDVEHSFICGEYHLAAHEGEANRTRGMIALCKEAGTNVAAGGAPLSFELLQQLYAQMATKGARWQNMVMFLPARLRQAVSSIYAGLPGANLPATRTQGGVKMSTIMTDFTNIDVVWNPFMPDDTVLLCDVKYMSPVFLPYRDMGVFFVQDLARTGAADTRQIYGAIGLDHGPGFLHGIITGIGASGAPKAAGK